MLTNTNGSCNAHVLNKATDVVRKKILGHTGLPRLTGQDQNSVYVLESNRLRELIRAERRRYPLEFYQFELQLLRDADFSNGPVWTYPPPVFPGFGLNNTNLGDQTPGLSRINWEYIHPQLLQAHIDSLLGF